MWESLVFLIEVSISSELSFSHDVFGSEVVLLIFFSKNVGFFRQV